MSDNVRQNAKTSIFVIFGIIGATAHLAGVYRNFTDFCLSDNVRQIAVFDFFDKSGAKPQEERLYRGF